MSKKAEELKKLKELVNRYKTMWLVAVLWYLVGLFSSIGYVLWSGFVVLLYSSIAEAVYLREISKLTNGKGA